MNKGFELQLCLFDQVSIRMNQSTRTGVEVTDDKFKCSFGPIVVAVAQPVIHPRSRFESRKADRFPLLVQQLHHVFGGLHSSVPVRFKTCIGDRNEPSIT